MLCILTIRLLLAYSFGSDLGGIANPQLEVQFRQQSLEPARMPTGFYPHTHFHSWCCEVTVELFRFLRVLQSPLSKFSSVGIHKCRAFLAHLRGFQVSCRPSSLLAPPLP